MSFGVAAIIILALLLPNALHFILILLGAASSYRKKKFAFSEINSITVVIPTRDEEVLIRKKLENVKEISADSHIWIVMAASHGWKACTLDIAHNGVRLPQCRISISIN